VRADEVPVSIVDQLEIVQIKEERGDNGIVAACAPDFA
jgi:hypothetical protein